MAKKREVEVEEQAEQMVDSVDVDLRTPEQKSKDAYDAEEARKKSQTEFDPKLHGVGTMPRTVPAHAKEMFEKWVLPLVDKVQELEGAVKSLLESGK